MVPGPRACGLVWTAAGEISFGGLAGLVELLSLSLVQVIDSDAREPRHHGELECAEEAVAGQRLVSLELVDGVEQAVGLAVAVRKMRQLECRTL